VPPAVAAIAGCVVERLIIDDSVTLFLQAVDRGLSLRFDTAASLRGPGLTDEAVTISPDTDASSAAPLLAWLHQRIVGVDLAADGTLELRSKLGVLSLWPDEHQMAWTLRSSAGEQVSCVADGKVIWG